MEKNPKCSPYDLRALETWLMKLAGDGLELTDEWKEFREGEKKEKRFYIEPAEENTEPPQSLRDSRALLGWEYVCPMEKNAFYVWRSTGETAHPPHARELTGSWCDRRLGQKLLWWWFGELAAVALPFGVAVFLLRGSDMPLWLLLTDGSMQMSILTLLLGLFCGFWATRREHRDLRRLRRAVRAGEYEKPVAQHKVLYEVMRWLPIVITVMLLIPFVGFGGGEPGARSLPFLAAEDLGGEADDRFVETRNTPLCDLTLVQEGHSADWNSRKNWFEYDTQLEVYRLRLDILAKLLMRELTQHFNMAQVDVLDSAETYYTAENGVQRMLLRDGGTVLFYRTDAPDDLRLRADAFTALLEAYR